MIDDMTTFRKEPILVSEIFFLPKLIDNNVNKFKLGRFHTKSHFVIDHCDVPSRRYAKVRKRPNSTLGIQRAFCISAYCGCGARLAAPRTQTRQPPEAAARDTATGGPAFSSTTRAPPADQTTCWTTTAQANTARDITDLLRSLIQPPLSQSLPNSPVMVSLPLFRLVSVFLPVLLLLKHFLDTSCAILVALRGELVNFWNVVIIPLLYTYCCVNCWLYYFGWIFRYLYPVLYLKTCFYGAVKLIMVWNLGVRRVPEFRWVLELPLVNNILIYIIYNFGIHLE